MSVQKILDKLNIYKHLGYEELDNGTKLIGKVPHIAPLAWLHKIFGPLNSESISDLEQRLGKNIPSDYKEFLSITNGLHVFNTAFCLDGHRSNYNRTTDQYLPFDLATVNNDETPSMSKPEYFFIGNYDWDGSHLYINSNTKFVHRCERHNAEPLNTWNSFREMLNSEIDRLISIHNDQGIILDDTIKTIPTQNDW